MDEKEKTNRRLYKLQRTEKERNVEELKKKTLNTINSLYINFLENVTSNIYLRKDRNVSNYIIFCSVRNS